MPAQIRWYGHAAIPGSKFGQISCPHAGVAGYEGPAHGYRGFVSLRLRKSMHITLKPDRIELCDGLEEDDE